MSFLFAPAAGRGTFPPSADGESPAEVQRKTPRPERANPLTQFVCPGQPVLKKLPPRQGEPACAVQVPSRPVQRKRVPHTDICPPVKTKYFYALHYKSDVL